MRKKVVTSPTLTSWADVDQALKLIGEMECIIEELQTDLNRKISQAKEEAEAQARPVQEKMRSLEHDVRDFVQQNRSELGGKTKQLNFGKTGFRLSTKLVTPKAAEIIASLKRYKMQDCITVKESINKDALKRYPTEVILKTGAYLKADDEFWYEVDREKLHPAD